MSAAEVIETIKSLPREEQQKVVSFIHAAENSGALEKPQSKVSDDFKRSADEMFTTNAELFRKLAQ
jgi:hypothetical protein